MKKIAFKSTFVKLLAIVLVALIVCTLLAAGMWRWRHDEAVWLVRHIPIIGRLFRRPTSEEQIERYGAAARLRLNRIFAERKTSYPPERVALIAIKSTREMEIYCASKSSPYKYLCSYQILGASGHLGPKLNEGDYQVPEGLYQIELEPNTPYHLALRINYPNSFDSQHATEDHRNPGSDIMIHGTTGSAGCLAMGDEASEDLFTLVFDTNPANIQLIITPVDFRTDKVPPDVSDPPKWLPELYKSIKSALRDYPIPSK